MQGATQLPNGAFFLKIREEDLHLGGDEKTREKYEEIKRLAAEAAPPEFEEDEEMEMKERVMGDQFFRDIFFRREFSEMEQLARLDDLSVFKNGEEYDFVKDVRDAYWRSLEKSNVEKVYETLPDHVFWDIKTPTFKRPYGNFNKINPFRPINFRTFFEIRDYDDYAERQEKQPNLTEAKSYYRPY